MAVPERNIDTLLSDLGNYPVRVSLDRGKRDPWFNWQRASRMVAPGATHHLILQDDAILSKNFIPAVQQVIAARPNAPISFFSMRKEIADAVRKGKRWVTMSFPLGAVAQVFPVALLPKIRAYGRAAYPPHMRHSDTVIASYLENAGIRLWHTAPSLVDHGLGKSAAGHPSLMFGRERRASAFIGREKSGTALDWTQGVDDDA